jgi:hypothetical protein
MPLDSLNGLVERSEAGCSSTKLTMAIGGAKEGRRTATLLPVPVPFPKPRQR